MDAAKKKQQKQLILLFVIIAAMAAVFLYSAQSKNKSSIPTNVDNLPSSVPVASSGINSIGNSEKDSELDILSSDKFKNLEKMGNYPVEAGETKRDNPFIPYQD